ncbi:MAG TPA: hypothetical protein VK939_11595, partial [Longimicrobiales bacterium]|nr:hypothetical protein [Longimicrobiales bacterium]
DVEEHYPVERELVMLGGYPIGMRLHVARASGEPVAVLHVASALDLAPDATPEERNILRLIAAALLVAAGELGN